MIFIGKIYYKIIVYLRTLKMTESLKMVVQTYVSKRNRLFEKLLTGGGFLEKIIVIWVWIVMLYTYITQ